MSRVTIKGLHSRQWYHQPPALKTPFLHKDLKTAPREAAKRRNCARTLKRPAHNRLFAFRAKEGRITLRNYESESSEPYEFIKNE